MNRFVLVVSGPSRGPVHSHLCWNVRGPRPRLARIARLAVLVALATTSALVRAEPPLTLGETQRIATERSKKLDASDFAVSASKDLTVAAAERPDPIAKIGVENLPINGSERFSVQQDFMTMRS